MTSYEELKKQKSDKIKEWLEYLTNNNEDDILWKQRNRIYASSVPDWLYLMAKEKHNDIIDKQYEIAQHVVKYINELDREKVYSIVKQLNDLEDGKTINEFHFDHDEIISQANKKIAEIEKEELAGKTEEEQILLKEKWKKEDEEFKKIFNNNSYVIDDDKITITKKEYDHLKGCQEDLYQIEEFIAPSNDFTIKLQCGSVLPITHPNYYNNRIDIEILDIEKYSIKIEKEEYRINFEVLRKIKEFINKNLNILINYSLSQNKRFMLNNSLEGGGARTITIKYGKLIILIDGQVTGEIGEFCKIFINEIKDIIINADIIEVTNDNDTINLLVEKIKLLPNGTEFTISQLVDVDTDKVLSISIDTFKKLEEQGIKIKSKFGEGAIVGLPQNTTYIKVSDDNFGDKITDENLKIIIEEVIGNNDIYLNTQVYDIVKKIIDLPNQTTTTIANLINYNPKEKFVEPITQGKIRILVDKICKKLNIGLEDNKDKFGVLAYYVEFRKIDNDRF